MQAIKLQRRQSKCHWTCQWKRPSRTRLSPPISPLRLAQTIRRSLPQARAQTGPPQTLRPQPTQALRLLPYLTSLPPAVIAGLLVVKRVPAVRTGLLLVLKEVTPVRAGPPVVKHLRIQALRLLPPPAIRPPMQVRLPPGLPRPRHQVSSYRVLLRSLYRL